MEGMRRDQGLELNWEGNQKAERAEQGLSAVTQGRILGLGLLLLRPPGDSAGLDLGGPCWASHGVTPRRSFFLSPRKETEAVWGPKSVVHF